MLESKRTVSMTARHRQEKNVLWGLAGGFGLTIVLLLGSGFLGIKAIDTVESRSEALLRQHRIATQLIDEIQGEEVGLSSLFYALTAASANVDRAALLSRLQSIEHDVGTTLEAARGGSHAARWEAARVAVQRFIGEVRGLLTEGNGRLELLPRFYRAHEELVTAISSLVSANYDMAIEQERNESAAHGDRLRQALVLLGGGLGVALLCAALAVWIVVRVFREVMWQAGELSRLSGRMLETQEEMLQRFSRELHDEFGQTLTAIKANLAAVPATSPEAASRVEDCTLLVEDLMHQVRELSHVLRPSVIDDFGLATGLQSLAEGFAQRTGIEVVPHLAFDGRLPGETETHLFRIAQEALTNAAKHSGATRIELTLERVDGLVRLTVADNGSGLKADLKTPGPGGGIGLAGMRERMRVAGGHLDILPGPGGVHVIAEVKADESERQAHPDLARR